MAQKTTVMNVDIDGDDELNLIKDARVRSNACYKCGEVGHFQRDCKYDRDKPTDSQQAQGQASCSVEVNDQFSSHHTLYSQSHEKLVCRIEQTKRPQEILQKEI